MCLAFLMTNAQTVSILKIYGTDTISMIKAKDNRYTELTFSNKQTTHQRIVAFDRSCGDISPSKIIGMFYDNNSLSFLLNYYGRNYGYGLALFDGKQWTLKILKDWKDGSRYTGIGCPEMYKTMVETIEMPTPYEVNVTYLKQAMGKKFIFSLDGKTQMLDYQKK